MACFVLGGALACGLKAESASRPEVGRPERQYFSDAEGPQGWPPGRPACGATFKGGTNVRPLGTRGSGRSEPQARRIGAADAVRTHPIRGVYPQYVVDIHTYMHSQW